MQCTLLVPPALARLHRDYRPPHTRCARRRIAAQRPAVRWRVLEARALVRDSLFPHPDTLPTPSIALAEQPTIAHPTFTPPQTLTPLPIEEAAGLAVSTAASPATAPPTTPICPTPPPYIVEDLPPPARLTGAVHEY